MGFEKEVLAKVEKIVKRDDMAGFYSGTLFVVCDETDGKKILRKLNKDYNNKVQMSPDGSYGYCYDFVA